jgi:plastocyanin
MHFTTAALASIVGAASAKTIRIDAGEGGLKFEPANTKAEMGDMLEFHFYPQKHSVVRGNPDMPCQPVEEDGFFSDFHPTMDGEAVSFVVRQP